LDQGTKAVEGGGKLSRTKKASTRVITDIPKGIRGRRGEACGTFLGHGGSRGGKRKEMVTDLRSDISSSGQKSLLGFASKWKKEGLNRMECGRKGDQKDKGKRRENGGTFPWDSVSRRFLFDQVMGSSTCIGDRGYLFLGNVAKAVRTGPEGKKKLKNNEEDEKELSISK